MTIDDEKVTWYIIYACPGSKGKNSIYMTEIRMVGTVDLDLAKGHAISGTARHWQWKMEAHTDA
jgi:hypothetical protein